MRDGTDALEGSISRRRFLGWLSASGLTLAAGIPWSGRPAQARGVDVTVLTHATLIDGTGASPRRDTTIVIVGDRLAAIGRLATAPPKGARLVDLRGKYVLPGLIDMHAHTLDLEAIFPPLYVVNGVTTVREMWGRPFHHRLRDRIEAGGVIGPRMVIGSQLVDGPTWQTGPDVTEVRTREEAQRAVRRAKQAGAEFVKVLSSLSEPTLKAVANESDRLGLPFAGHLPDEVRTEVGSRLGMRTMEHLYGLIIDVSTVRDELRRQIAERPISGPDDSLARWLWVRQTLEREALAKYDPGRADKVFDGLTRRGTAIDPTLNVVRNFCFPPDVLMDDPLVKYVPSWVKAGWDQQINFPWTPDDVAAGRAAWEAQLRLVGELGKSGVTLTAGTDCGLPAYGFPGFSLHDELNHLVNAGLTPMRAIVAATGEAARIAGVDHVVGTVTSGKSADLLVVDADPLADIANTKRIHAIVHRGRIISTEQRARILTDVEEAARNTPPPAQTLAACCGGPTSGHAA